MIKSMTENHTTFDVYDNNVRLAYHSLLNLTVEQKQTTSNNFPVPGSTCTMINRFLFFFSLQVSVHPTSYKDWVFIDETSL